MKRLALAAILVASGAVNAMAADMAVKAPPPAPVAAIGWTGFYAGINAGYGQSRDTSLISEAIPRVFVLNGQNQTALSAYNMSGALVGLQGGYNYQFGQNWLIGVETDIQATSIKGSGTSSITSL